MLSSALDASPVPGVDLACNAMYLSLVGEVPEMYCPPGCTLHATTQGTIYVLDHVRRVGYPLHLTSMANAGPTAPMAPPAHPLAAASAAVAFSPHAHAAEGSYMLVPEQPSSVSTFPSTAASPTSAHYAPTETSTTVVLSSCHKRSRASSTDSRAPSSSHRVWDRRRGSPESSDSADPTAPHHAVGDDVATPASAPFAPPQHLTMKNSPQFCLIPPRRRWLEDIYFTLQLGSQYTHHPNVLFFCHYCRVYFAATPRGIWRHLSNAKGHRVQRQRVRGYMVSGNRLFKSPEERMLRIATPEEIQSVPEKHFQHADRLQQKDAVHFVPACVKNRSIMNPEQRANVARDGTPHAAKVITREDLLGSTPQSFMSEPPQLVGWRFLMEGLDIVHCYCNKTNERLLEYRIFGHHKEKDNKKN